jgi:pilus assembly protein Flp/PilA
MRSFRLLGQSRLAGIGLQFWLEEASMSKFFKRFLKDESGATAIEYGLIAAIIGIGLITGLGLLQSSLDGTFTRVSSALDAAGS